MVRGAVGYGVGRRRGFGSVAISSQETILNNAEAEEWLLLRGRDMCDIRTITSYGENVWHEAAKLGSLGMMR